MPSPYRDEQWCAQPGRPILQCNDEWLVKNLEEHMLFDARINAATTRFLREPGVCEQAFCQTMNVPIVKHEALARLVARLRHTHADAA